MTTDSTELALLVSKAKASVFTLEYISQFEPADIDSDDVDFRFEVDGRDTGTNVSIVDECGQAAKVIGALVEALEKAQADGNEYAASEWAVAVKNVEQQDEIHELERRIAELESRTVKLPKPISVLHRREFTEAHCAIYAYPEAEVTAALDDAGIKVEAE